MTLGLWGIKDNDISKYEPDSGYLSNKTSSSSDNLLNDNSKTELPLNDASTTISYGKETVYPYTVSNKKDKKKPYTEPQMHVDKPLENYPTTTETISLNGLTIQEDISSKEFPKFIDIAEDFNSDYEEIHEVNAGNHKYVYTNVETSTSLENLDHARLGGDNEVINDIYNQVYDDPPIQLYEEKRVGTQTSQDHIKIAEGHPSMEAVHKVLRTPDEHRVVIQVDKEQLNDHSNYPREVEEILPSDPHKAPNWKKWMDNMMSSREDHFGIYKSEAPKDWIKDVVRDQVAFMNEQREFNKDKEGKIHSDWKRHQPPLHVQKHPAPVNGIKYPIPIRKKETGHNRQPDTQHPQSDHHRNVGDR